MPTKPSAVLLYTSKDRCCTYWSNQSNRLSKSLSFVFSHNKPWQRIVVVCLFRPNPKEMSLNLLQFNLRVSFSFSTLKKILENSHSHSQLSKNSLRTLILILNSQKNPWEISFSISTLSKLTLAEVCLLCVTIKLLKFCNSSKILTKFQIDATRLFACYRSMMDTWYISLSQNKALQAFPSMWLLSWTSQGPWPKVMGKKLEKSPSFRMLWLESLNNWKKETISGLATNSNLFC